MIEKTEIYHRKVLNVILYKQKNKVKIEWIKLFITLLVNILLKSKYCSDKFKVGEFIKIPRLSWIDKDF